MRNCTFTGNRNAVDDMGSESTYANCIFVDNNLSAGLKGTERYELDLQAGAKVTGCFINGPIRDPRHSVSSKDNMLNALPPKFGKDFVPQAPQYDKTGYRPVSNRTGASEQNR